MIINGTFTYVTGDKLAPNLVERPTCVKCKSQTLRVVSTFTGQNGVDRL